MSPFPSLGLCAKHAYELASLPQVYFYFRIHMAFLKFEEKVLISLDVFATSLGKYLLGYYG